MPLETGEALTEIRDFALFKAAGWCTFRQYVTANRKRFGFDYKKAERLIKATSLVKLLPVDLPKPLNLLHVQPLCHLQEDDVAHCWKSILGKAGRVSRITSSLATAEVEMILGRRIRFEPVTVDVNLGNSHQASNNWHTPIVIIEKVTALFGGCIDLDPCSDDVAQRTVKAKKYYTADNNGLCARNPWSGKVFINPPYGLATGNMGMQELFLDRAMVEHRSGSVSECVLLLKASVGAKWFQKVFGLPHGFLKERLSFSLCGEDSGRAMFGSVVVYMGPNVQEFVRIFADSAFFAGVNSWCL